MEEYVIKRATIGEWQKWLNQWKHIYHLEILNIEGHGDGECTIYLKRTQKDKDNE